jgi:hypothetical protein
VDEMSTMLELFGEPIAVYTREQAIADGTLVDVTEWGSADKGFMGGFRCPVAFTAALWAVVDIDGRKHRGLQSTRGRAHDVLWMASIALRSVARDGAQPGEYSTPFRLILTNGRQRTAVLRVVANGEGVTIGFPEDF